METSNMENKKIEIQQLALARRQRLITFLREAALFGLSLAAGAVIWIVLAI